MQTGAAHSAAPGLDSGWAAQRSWVVLDTVFGSGHAFLSLWQLWCTHAQKPVLLHYVGLLSTEQATGLADALHQANTPAPALAATLATHCYGLEPGFHRILLANGQLSLTLCVGERSALLAQQDLQADTLLAASDAGGWDKWQLKALARCCKRGTRLRFLGAPLPAPQLLGDAGFVPLAPNDTHDTKDTTDETVAQAVYHPRWQLRSARHRTPQGTAEPGRCAVIGAGIAGASVARALAVRGWQVDVYDAQPHSAGGASGLPVGLVVPHHSADDSPRSRMSRSGTRLMLQHAGAMLRAQTDWNPGGVLELRVEASSLAAEEAELLSQAAVLAGSAWARPQAWGDTPGLWHPYAAWIQPALLVRAWLEHARIRFHGGAGVHRLQRQGPQWQLCAEDGGVLGQADIVVCANAHGSAALLQRLADAMPPDFPWLADVLPRLRSLQALQGTLSMGPCPAPGTPAAAAFPPWPVNGHGSFVAGVPGPHGTHWYAGSTFRSEAVPPDGLAQEHAANLGKLRALLPDVAAALEAQFANGAVQAWQGTRCVTSDRLPLVGPLLAEDAPTLWLCAGMGARGLSFSALCAELLAAELGAEPLPLESSLARALSTRRRQRGRSRDNTDTGPDGSA